MATEAKDAATLAEAFRITAGQRAGDTWVKNRDGSTVITWDDGQARVDRIAGGLRKLGVGKADTVALMLVNRPEFHIVDFGVVTAGGTPFSIYQTYTPDQIKYLLEDAETKVVVTERLFLPVVQEAVSSLDAKPQIVLVDPDGDVPDGVISLAEVEELDPEFDGAEAAAEIGPEDILTLIYTSGTTGPPKGVQLTHDNLMFMVDGTHEIVQFPDRSRVISWLPSAHIAE
ncbi:MAG: AMP-binding protein, partial [Solirubrobacterales bacterium]